MQINEYIHNICNQIKYKPIRNEIAEEFKNHIEELKENYIKEGINSNEAENMAIKQMGDAEEIGKKLNKIHKPKLDWKLILIICVSLIFGFVIAFIRQSNDGILKNVEFLVIGLIFSTLIYFFDYRKLSKYSNIIYIIASLCIIIALTSGAKVNGIPYLCFGIYKISASVIAVPLYIIAFAGFLNNFNKDDKKSINLIKEQNINITIDVNILKIIVLSVISILLFLLIPSMVSAFITGVTYLIITTVKIVQSSKNTKRKIAILWGIAVVIPLLVVSLSIIMHPYKLDRIYSSFNPEKDPNGGGWIGIQQKFIINSAKYYGTAENTSNAIELFDEGTNYAFISMLAHYGWIISIAMVVTVLTLCIKLIINSIKIKEIYGKLLTIGIASIFILQSIFNLLMNLNLGIKADFNIPLISYGGMSLIINLMCLALVLSVQRRKNIIINKKIA